MIETAHPVDGLVLAGVRIKCDDDAVLLRSRVAEGRRPRVLLPHRVVGRLLVREEDVLVESLLARGEEIGAEALEATTAVDSEGAVDHPPGRVHGELAHLRIVEVTLTAGRARGGRGER